MHESQLPLGDRDGTDNDRGGRSRVRFRRVHRVRWRQGFQRARHARDGDERKERSVLVALDSLHAVDSQLSQSRNAHSLAFVSTKRYAYTYLICGFNSHFASCPHPAFKCSSDHVRSLTFNTIASKSKSFWL